VGCEGLARLGAGCQVANTTDTTLTSQNTSCKLIVVCGVACGVWVGVACGCWVGVNVGQIRDGHMPYAICGVWGVGGVGCGVPYVFAYLQLCMRPLCMHVSCVFLFSSLSTNSKQQLCGLWSAATNVDTAQKHKSTLALAGTTCEDSPRTHTHNTCNINMSGP
jgi:hypothetical protein